MPAKPTPKDPVIDCLCQRIVARRSDLTLAQKHSLASILSHRARAFGLPGIDNLVTPLPIRRTE